MDDPDDRTEEAPDEGPGERGDEDALGGRPDGDAPDEGPGDAPEAGPGDETPEDEDPGDDAPEADRDDDTRADEGPVDVALEDEVAALREAVEALESHLDEHTVPRSAVEADLRQYVRRRIRRGHARGWGPYLVLLYGTAMTVGAFYLLSGVWAIMAMVVIWLSTLGLYVLMVLAGATFGLLSLPGQAVEAIRERRS